MRSRPHCVSVVGQEVKVSSPDYLTTDKDHAVDDFKRRIEVYEQQYNPLDEELDGNLSFIKIYNQGERYLINNIHGIELSSVQCLFGSFAFWMSAVSSVWFCIVRFVVEVLVNESTVEFIL